MKNKKNITIGFSLGFIVILNYLIFNIALKKEISLTKIPIVNAAIQPRSKISEEDITYLEVPKAFITEDFYTDKADIIGKYTDIRALMPKSSFFYKELLFEEKNLPDYPAILLKDQQVAYNLPTNLIKLSGNSIVVGQKVDIYTTYSNKDEAPIVDLLVKSVRVIGVKDRNGIDISNPESDNIPYLVLLALDKEILPIVRAAEEVANVELLAYSDKNTDKAESVLNNEAKILAKLQK